MIMTVSEFEGGAFRSPMIVIAALTLLSALIIGAPGRVVFF